MNLFTSNKFGLTNHYSRFIFIVLIYYVIIAPFYPELSKVAVRIILPLLFIVQLVISKSIPKYFITFVILYFYSALSILYCLSDEPYFEAIRKLTAVMLFSYLVSSIITRNPKFINSMYLIYLLLFFYSLYYSWETGIFSVNTSSERFDNDIFGTNVLGYYLFMGFFSLWFFFIESQTKRNRIFIVIAICLSISAGIYFLILGATRGGIIVTLVSLFLFVYNSFASKKSRVIRVSYFLFFALALYILSSLIYNRLEGMLIHERLRVISGNLGEEVRWKLLIDSMRIGFDNLLLGVGAGNVSLFLDGAFSHSSFTEIFANHGIIGIVLLFIILADFFRSVKRIQINSNPAIKQFAPYFMSFFFVFAMYNMLYVMYLHPLIMGFFYIMRTHLHSLESDGSNSDIRFIINPTS